MKTSNYIRINNGIVSAMLDVIIFAEDGVILAYAPALDLVGYDTTEKGAKKSFEIVFQEYIKYGIENRTLEEDLARHGWKKKVEEQFSSLDFLGLLTKNKRLQGVINNNYRKVSQKISCRVN